MGFGRRISVAALASVIVLGHVGIARSQEVATSGLPECDVTFTAIRDAVPNRFFDPDQTAADSLNPNRLLIGLHSGMDWTVWKQRDFKASSAAYSYTAAMDTIRVTITAPADCFISKVTYTQGGFGSVARIGFASGTGNWTVGGQVFNLGSFGTNPALSRTVDVGARQQSRISVAVTMNLTAFATAVLGAANLTLTSAELLVEAHPRP